MTDERCVTSLRTALLFTKGISQKNISETLVVSRKSIRSRIITYNREGKDGLRTKRPVDRKEN